jgi:hypothetical protein
LQLAPPLNERSLSRPALGCRWPPVFASKFPFHLPHECFSRELSVLQSLFFGHGCLLILRSSGRGRLGSRAFQWQQNGNQNGNTRPHPLRRVGYPGARWWPFSVRRRVGIPASAGPFLLPFCCRDCAATDGIRRDCGVRGGLPVAMKSDSCEPRCRPDSGFSDSRTGAVPGASTT